MSIGKEETEELDLSFGPRYCKKCGYEAEDGYQLDGHFWIEHDEEEENMTLLQCQHCDETFSIMKDLMIHKKKEHMEIVNICWNFSNDACPFGDKKCWFQLKLEPFEHDSNSSTKSRKCNICGNTFDNRRKFMEHKKEKHEENVEMCKLFEKGNCTYNNKCWFLHKSASVKDG